MCVSVSVRAHLLDRAEGWVAEPGPYNYRKSSSFRRPQLGLGRVTGMGKGEWQDLARVAGARLWLWEVAGGLGFELI